MLPFEQVNLRNLNALKDYEKLTYIQAVQLVLIGTGHDPVDISKVARSNFNINGDFLKNPEKDGMHFLVDHHQSCRLEFEDAIRKLPGYEQSKVAYLRK
jgi:hypothetical protein